MISRSIVKSIFLCLGNVVCYRPIFSETITIDKDELIIIIKTEAEKYVKAAVDEAVAIAIKDMEKKYIPIIAEKDKEIVELNGTIAKNKVSMDELKIQLANETIKFENYKNHNGLRQYLIVGGVALLSGFALDGLLRIIFIH